MFDTFWNLHNKKIGKIKCESKWIELTNDDRENIIKVLPNYVKSTPDVKFRKDPYTYLNNESWHDEIIFKDKDVEIQKSTTKDKYEEIY